MTLTTIATSVYLATQKCDIDKAYILKRCYVLAVVEKRENERSDGHGERREEEDHDSQRVTPSRSLEKEREAVPVRVSCEFANATSVSEFE